MSDTDTDRGALFGLTNWMQLRRKGDEERRAVD